MDKARQLLANNLKELRVSRSLTQSQIAELADFSIKMIQQIEYGAVNPSTDTITRLAKALGCQISDLYADSTVSLKGPDLSYAADVLTKLANLSPVRKSFVLALIYRDESYISGLSRALTQAYQALSKVP